jgi:hypothetical protein
VSDQAEEATVAFDRAVHRAARAVTRSVERERLVLLELLALARVAERPAG